MFSGILTISAHFFHQFLVIVDEIDNFPMLSESPLKHLRNALPVSFFVAVTSGSSELSSIAWAASSSSSRSFRRRSTERTLKRVINNSQLPTGGLAFEFANLTPDSTYMARRSP